MTMQLPGRTPSNVGRFQAESNANQTLTNGVATKISLQDENFDSDGWFDAVTNYRYTPQKAGKYYIHARVYMQAMAADKDVSVRIYKNGALYSLGQLIWIPISGNIAAEGGCIVDMNGTTDYIELYCQQNDTVGRDAANSSNILTTFMEGWYLGT